MTDPLKNGAPDLADDVTRTLALESAARRRRRRWRWFFAVLLVLIAGAGILKWEDRRQTPATQFVTLPATTGSLTVTVTATGNLQPINEVDVGSELSGIVRSVEVDYNDAVKQGQVLARLDTTKLQAQVLQSTAALAAAKAKVLQVQATIAETRAKRDRLKNLSVLSEQRAVSQLDIDVADAALARAEADKAAAIAEADRAKAILEANETDLGKAVIRSPINGVVLVRAVEPGQTVAASLQAPVLFTLAEDLSQMALHVDVDEADVGQVKAGQEATFTVDAFADRVFPAQITQVRFGSKTTGGVVTYETLLKVDNGDLLLRPGMTATAEIVVRKIENALLVPNAALRFTPPATVQGGQRRSGGILTRLFPRPQRNTEKKPATAGNGKTQLRVWTLRDGRSVPVAIFTGMTDGASTQVTGGDLQPGMPLIVDVVTQGK
ncbi:MAG: efflux RND transporter periplasmic adaptor subunit [Pseudomonadota bacterium]